MEALVVENLTKRYDRDDVLKDVSFNIDSGAFGLIGPNGAGKTTLIKIICGLLAPSSGRVLVDGHPPGSPVANAAIGYLSERQGYYELQTPQEYLGLFGALHGLSPAQTRERTLELLAKVGLAKNAQDRISTFSRGMRQRLGIARAMLHRPKLYLLDEPLSGLDPTGRKEVMRVLSGLRQEGSTVPISSRSVRHCIKKWRRSSSRKGTRIPASVHRSDLRRFGRSRKRPRPRHRDMTVIAGIFQPSKCRD
jgi:ABC-type multidrug transport system ATPase subunit